ncbi:hypothetical protein F5972_11165 [Microbispora cellulosiformans]|uniref:Uncharacterized protein n=1 Tax=Microbispora cellulosiformans TaxID=2614688 RepID=A0A5J5K6C9_9ACTN|nr:hypothetical protein [Microbispora cellulosiformans]KAA9378805.1 hypothetical protein F5972_11165 [Microbispora cellulosiformans]
MARSYRGARGGRRRVPLLAGLLSGAVITQALLALPAAAAGRAAQDPPGGRGPASIGNGTRDRNVVFLDSPTHSRGHQHTRASTAGGASNVEDGFCRRVTNCDIRQNLTVVIGAAAS